MRSFVAIELPEAIRRQLAALQERLRPQARGVSWTRSEQIHLTIKFLGEVSDAVIPQAIETARNVARQHVPFDLTVAGAGCFPPHGSARVLWVGLPFPPQELVACQQDFEQAFAAIGFPPENRPFHPHLTLARVKDPRAGHNARTAIEQAAQFHAGDFRVDELIFFQSVLQRTGPIYTPMARLPLAAK